MRIRKLLWPDERVDHVARHNVTPAEVEEICFGNNPLVLRAKSQGQNAVYYVPGRTRAGRYLFCVVIARPAARHLIDPRGHGVRRRFHTTALSERGTLNGVVALMVELFDQLKDDPRPE